MTIIIIIIIIISSSLLDKDSVPLPWGQFFYDRRTEILKSHL